MFEKNKSYRMKNGDVANVLVVRFKYITAVNSKGLILNYQPDGSYLGAKFPHAFDLTVDEKVGLM